LIFITWIFSTKIGKRHHFFARFSAQTTNDLLRYDIEIYGVEEDMHKPADTQSGAGRSAPT